MCSTVSGGAAVAIPAAQPVAVAEVSQTRQERAGRKFARMPRIQLTPYRAENGLLPAGLLAGRLPAASDLLLLRAAGLRVLRAIYGLPGSALVPAPTQRNCLPRAKHGRFTA